MNEPRKAETSKPISWQQAKHTSLYSDRIQAQNIKKEAFGSLGLQQRAALGSVSAVAPSLGQFSSVQSLDRVGRVGDMREDSAEILFQPFLQVALVSSSGMDRDVHSLVDPAFPLLTTASPTLQGALEEFL